MDKVKCHDRHVIGYSLKKRIRMLCRLLDGTDISDTDRLVKLTNANSGTIILDRYIRAWHDEPSAEESGKDDWAGFKANLAREEENGYEDALLRHDVKQFYRESGMV